MDVEKYICEQLMRLDGWQQWVLVDDGIYDPKDISDLGSFVRDEGSPNTTGQRFVVVFPFCSGDGQQAVKLMQWISELGPYEHEIIISADSLTPASINHSVNRLASLCFPTVKNLSYTAPGHGEWPPTIAFKAAAFRVQRL